MNSFRNIITGLLLIVSVQFITGQNYNQYGFVSSSEKYVFFGKDLAGKPFVLQNEDGQEVFNGRLTAAREWPCSETSVGCADLSEWSKEGHYQLLVDGLKQPVPVLIQNDRYSGLGSALVKSFYMARASVAIEEQYAGVYARPAGHPDDKVIIHKSAADAYRPEGSTIESPGGWYDAGDYGKYIVNSGISTFSLLHLCELFPEYTQTIQLNIPESGNGASDVLNEAVINLKWMLTMQNPNDGGVYHKLTTKRFCGMVMPHKDPLQRYVVMKTTAATLDFAATMAKASRVLKANEQAYPGLAETCRQAAQKAWEWCLANPQVYYVQPKDISTGEYKDDSIEDEWFWAATELYLTTGMTTYKKHINIGQQKFTVPQWGRVNTLGLYSLLSCSEGEELAKEGGKAIVKLANKYLANYKASAYRVSIVKFPWGSNSELANEGMLLMHAYLISNKTQYLQVADAAVGYLLGANPLNRSFITAYGKQPPMRVHDRRCSADGIDAPIPGLLAGGPSKQAQHDCGKELYLSDAPALSYLDEECSFSTNEVAINWNAAASFLVLGLDAIYQSED